MECLIYKDQNFKWRWFLASENRQTIISYDQSYCTKTQMLEEINRLFFNISIVEF